jgi:hypothetical protein
VNEYQKTSVRAISTVKEKKGSIYSRDEVERVLAAYKDLFPQTGGELSRYWDFDRQRPWSCLTTNFHSATYEQFAALHSQWTALLHVDQDVLQKGNALRAASRECGVGYSLGICPWTDDLLLRTYNKDAQAITIIIGHDWYPIVKQDGLLSDSPLVRASLFDVSRYVKAMPAGTLNGSNVVLFLNLYPDYRPPGMDILGKLDRYDEWLTGLDEVVLAARARYRQVSIMSWGKHVWETLRTRVDTSYKKTSLMHFTNLHSGTILRLPCGGAEIPYLPIAHPSFAGNFSTVHHKKHMQIGFGTIVEPMICMPAPV